MATNDKQWAVYEKFAEIHIVPENDIIEHNLDFLKCKCAPIIDESNYNSCTINHKSFDMREQYENIH